MKLTKVNIKSEQTKGYLFYLGILTLIVVVVWIATSVYAAVSNVEPDTHMAKLIKPLDPNLDTEVIAAFQQSRQPAPEQFLIRVTEKDANETTTSILDPFSNQITTEIEVPEAETQQSEIISPDIPESTPSAVPAQE